MYTLWGRRNSVNVQKVLWCLDELDADFQRHEAGLAHGQNDQGWFLDRNPTGLIPLLEEADWSLWESNSIVRYLCARHSAGVLWPLHPRERADAERWMDWQLSMLEAPMRVVFVNLVRTPPEQRDMTAVHQAHRLVTRAFSILEKHLADHAYVAGEQFTMGDIPAGACLHRWLALPDIERPGWPALAGWYRRLCERRPYREQVVDWPLS